MKNHQIKSILNDEIIFEHECCSFKECVEIAVKKGIRLIDANFRDADLKSANLCGAVLAGSDFNNANLYGATLRYANLRHALFNYTNLAQSDLSHTNLWEAQFFAANLYGADIRFADLGSAELSCTHLARASLQGATIRNTSFPSPTEVLLADWGVVSKKLCIELMKYDASNHENPKSFNKWKQTGDCPYSHKKYERAAKFLQIPKFWKSRHLWRKPKPAYKLMQMVLKEKCNVQ